MKTKQTKLKNKMRYYHITQADKNTIWSISLNGLRGNDDGEIFLFENKSIQFEGVINTVADCIARNQIFLKKYAMFEINPIGIKSEIINDNVGESSARCQWYIKQAKIHPKHIKLFGVFDTEYKPFSPQIKKSNN